MGGVDESLIVRSRNVFC